MQNTYSSVECLSHLSLYRVVRGAETYPSSYRTKEKHHGKGAVLCLWTAIITQTGPSAAKKQT